MAKKIDNVLHQTLKKIKPSKEELKFIEENLADIKKRIKGSIEKTSMEVQFFVGGSYAKGTLVRKDNYDIDIFLRFDKKHKKEGISKLSEKILKKSGLKFETIHGSRDYFRVVVDENLVFEIIPVLKIRKHEEAENITDLSYFHVKYVNKKMKGKQIRDEIRLAKAFCYANKCYGAESYIKGFSGYGLELLVYNYKSFGMFLNQMYKVDKKEIIDIEFHHKSKSKLLLDLNESKLQSPVVLIDPTHKYRNVLAALSYKTFRKFQNVAKKFRKSPSIKYFERQKPDFEKLEKEAEKKKEEFQILEITTNKRPGDVAGSKLLKFYDHLSKEISKYFIIKNKGFEYNQDKTATCFFSVKKKSEVLIKGPKTTNEKHAKRFKKSHKNSFVKKGRLYAKKRLPGSLESYLAAWSLKNATRMKEMSIEDFELRR